MLTRMRILVHPHALTHGLSELQIRDAYQSGVSGAVIRDRDRPSEPQRWATIGFDAQGHDIELVFVRLEDGTPLIIHANKATTRLRTEIRKGRRR